MREDEIRNSKVLIVDDQEDNVLYLEILLRNAGYTQLISTTDPREVLPLYSEVYPDLIVLDLMMPELDGFGVMAQLEPLIPADSFVPILVLTANITPEAKRKALAMGAKDFLTKPFDSTEVLLRIKNLLETRYLHLWQQNQNQILEQMVQERTRDLRERTVQLEEAQVEILERLALAAEYRDDDTGQHAQRVGRLAALVASELGMPAAQSELLRLAVPLHDLGKIGIPDEVLLKTGKLSPEELDIMKAHTIVGARILSGGKSELIRIAQLIALTHHERWDGSGYPHHISGDKIPLVGRIVGLVDVFDALTHPRTYKEGWSVPDAVAELRRQAGAQFDPDVVEAFLLVLQREGANIGKTELEIAAPPPPSGESETNVDDWLNEAKEAFATVTYQQTRSE